MSDFPCEDCTRHDDCPTRGAVAWVEETARKSLGRQLRTIGAGEACTIKIDIHVASCGEEVKDE